MASDPFETLLNLEDQFYQSGYAQGEADGHKAGLLEGRSLGLEKGFQKFVESSRLHGKAIVWANRLPILRPSKEKLELPTLPSNARLEKNVTMLFGLTEPESLSTENTDEAVNDFDDRLKRAQGKAKIIEKAVGEETKEHVGEAVGSGKGRIADVEV